MSIRSLRWLAVAGIAVACSGCRLGSVSIGYYDDDNHYRRHRTRHVTRIHTGHVCSSGCSDHYWDGGRVVMLTDHHHGYDCGHHWDGSHWIAEKVRHIGRKIHKKFHKSHKSKKIKIKRRRYHD